jgi:hypothetical protein
MAFMSIGSGLQLEHNTALAYFKAIAAGMPPGGINSAYRSPADQVWQFNDNYTSNYAASAKRDRRTWNGVKYWRRLRKVSNGAPTVSVAVPKTSTHEDGIALDLGPAQRTWMFAHGHEFGFVNPEWAKDPDTFEPWHWEWVGSTSAPVNPSPTKAEEPPDMTMTILITEKHGWYNFTLGTVHHMTDKDVITMFQANGLAKVWEVSHLDLERLLLEGAGCPRGQWPAPGHTWYGNPGPNTVVGVTAPADLDELAELVADELDRRAAKRLDAVKDA